MKKSVLYICFLLPLLLTGQTNLVTISKAYETDTEPYVSYKWILNGKVLGPKTKTIKVKTHYPLFDTIIFMNGVSREKVITRFKPGKKYVITLGCCDAGFDIHDAEPRHYERLFDSIPDWQYDSIRLSEENPPIDFNVINHISKDTLIGLYADLYACLGNGFMLKNNMHKRDLWPSKSGYADNRDFIMVAVRKDTLLPEVWDNGWFRIDENEGFNLWCESIRVVTKVQVRFMYHEKILAVYDAKRKRLKLKILN